MIGVRIYDRGYCVHQKNKEEMVNNDEIAAVISLMMKQPKAGEYYPEKNLMI